MAQQITGSCLCGRVTYTIDGDPVFAALCHCSDCRKSSGTGHAAAIAVPDEAVKLQGETRGYSSQTDSGNTATRHFCPNCGSPIYNTNTGMSGMKIVHVGGFDDPNLFEPQMVVFASRAAKWDKAGPGLPSFVEMPPMG
jgi:hypothetical protein